MACRFCPYYILNYCLFFNPKYGLLVKPKQQYMDNSSLNYAMWQDWASKQAKLIVFRLRYRWYLLGAFLFTGTTNHPVVVFLFFFHRKKWRALQCVYTVGMLKTAYLYGHESSIFIRLIQCICLTKE